MKKFQKNSKKKSKISKKKKKFFLEQCNQFVYSENRIDLKWRRFENLVNRARLFEANSVSVWVIERGKQRLINTTYE